jgi:Protein of unknwon function (DUF3310)
METMESVYYVDYIAEGQIVRSKDTIINKNEDVLDTFTLDLSTLKHNTITNTEVQYHKYKYNEDVILTELRSYIDKTYGSHYGDKVQAQDLIVSSGHGEGFYLGNIIKYASRYGKKNGHNKDDLLKVLHYAVLAMNHHILNHEKD